MNINIESRFNKVNEVNEVKLLQELKSTLLGFWPNRKNNNFPGALPVSIERKNFEAIKKYPYVISLKSNGIRFLMMAYNKNVYLVDRLFNFYKTNQNFNINIYGSTPIDTCGLLLDGEMMFNNTNSTTITDSTTNTNTNNDMLYIIHDCLCVFSKDITKEYFTDRYDSIKSAVSLWSPEHSDFKIKIKKFYMYNDLTRDIIEKADHDIDGLIFTPIKLGIGTGTQHTLFKWKYKHTFDFLIKDENNEYVSYVYDKNVLIKYASVKKRNVKFSKLLKKNCPDFKSGDIVECICNVVDEDFEPLFLRKDKSHPNSLYTIEKTIINIKENITLDEMMELIYSTSIV